MKKLSFRKSLGAEKEPLSQQFVLYIPNKDSQGRTIKNFNSWVKDARKILTIIGGGATAMPPADGSWIDPIKILMILQSYNIVILYGKKQP